MFAILPQFVSPRALLGPDLGILLSGVFVATMGPMVVTAWLGAGTRSLGHRYVALLTRIAASALILFAGLTAASMAWNGANPGSGAIARSFPIPTDPTSGVPQEAVETKVADASGP